MGSVEMAIDRMKVLVTGANGFIGRNFITRINEIDGLEALPFLRSDSIDKLTEYVSVADAVVHLAGENRPSDIEDYYKGNTDFTHLLCDLVGGLSTAIPFVFASSIQSLSDNPYGRSKLAAEHAVLQLRATDENAVSIFRLPGVFGKWCKPNYNSVVATFCNNLALGLPISVNDPDVKLKLVYVDDVVDGFLDAIRHKRKDNSGGFKVIDPVYTVTLGDLEAKIRAFSNCRTSLVSEPVGAGFMRALYSTYVSYLPLSKFSYKIPSHGDERGVFVEMLKTHDSGQFSFFTAHPSITRGGHYHHTKTEKFLVIKGTAKFGFRHILTGERHSIKVSGDLPEIVETVPGWSHDITNVGDDELIVMLWANEIFDRDKPDTISSEV